MLLYRTNYVISKGSTGNLIRHLKSNHPTKYKKEEIQIGPIDNFLTDNNFLVSLIIIIIFKFFILIFYILDLYFKEISGKTYSLDSL